MSKNQTTTLATVFKIFELIKQLSSSPYYTVPQLARHLDRSERTVYQYLKLLEDIGLEPDSNRQHQYFLPVERDRKSNHPVDLAGAKYLQEMLWQMPDEDPRRNQLLLWVNRQYAVGPVVEMITSFSPAQLRQELTRALEEKKRVRLLNYRNSKGVITTRYVEPVAFQKNYSYIYCFDLEATLSEDDAGYRQFKLARVGKVEVLEEYIEKDHTEKIPDLFGWTGPRWRSVNLELGPQAKQLLLEEYPAAKPYVVPMSGGKFLAELNVKGWPGIGRWVMGLAHDVRVLAGGDAVEFREWVNNRWRRF